MIPKADPRFTQCRSAPGTQLGVDVGATLTKLAIRRRDGDLELRAIPWARRAELPGELARLAAERVGLTGGGSHELRRALPGARVVDEFDAWAAGARALLLREGDPPPERFLLVSVGTGTGALLVTGEGVERVGGTALGGGTVAGLSAALVGTSDPAELAALARAGDRGRVDLLVEDIYPEGGVKLPGKINAASFAKLARGGEAASRADLVRAVMGLVAENIGWICGGLAAVAGVDRIVYGGSTLRDEPLIADTLRAMAPIHGCTASIPADGAYTGAVGALELAAAE